MDVGTIIAISAITAFASVYLEPAGEGSSARVVTTKFVDDPDAFTKRLLAGC